MPIYYQMGQMFINNRPEEKSDIITVDEERWLFESQVRSLRTDDIAAGPQTFEPRRAMQIYVANNVN